MEASKTMAEADVVRQGKMGDSRKNRFSLKVGAAMAAEIAGVCVLTSILDLIFCKCLSVQNINQRINIFFSTTDRVFMFNLAFQSVLVIISGRVCGRRCVRSLMDRRVYDWPSEICVHH